MAVTSLVSISLMDDAGRSGTVTFSVAANESLADITALAEQLAERVDAISGAKVMGASVALSLDISGAVLKAAALDDHPLQYGANFSFDAANTNYRYTLHVPAIRQSMVDDGVINLTNGAIIAFIGDVRGDAVTIPTRDRYGNGLGDLLGAEVAFRKR